MDYLSNIANLPQKTYDKAVNTILSAKNFAFDFIHPENTFIDYEKEQFNFIDFIFESKIVSDITQRNQLNHFRGTLLGFHLMMKFQTSDYLSYQEHIESFEKYHKLIVEKINNAAPKDKKIEFISFEKLKKLINKIRQDYDEYIALNL